MTRWSRRFLHSTGRRRPRSAPVVEALECRRLPSTFSPLASAADGSANSLRAAVIAANANGQDNTIALQAGTYQLSLRNTAGQENAAAQGDLDLIAAGHTLTIEGKGAGVTIIDGGGVDRVFQVMSGVNVVIGSLTIQDGFAQDDGSAGTPPGTVTAAGGGILNAGTLELDDDVVQGCMASGGYGLNGTAGGGFNSEGMPGQDAQGGGIANVGTLTLNRCTIRGNSAQGGAAGSGYYTDYAFSEGGGGGEGGYAEGGGIYDSGSLTVSQSAIVGNTAGGGPGGDGGLNLAGPGGGGGPGGPADGGGLSIFLPAPQTLIVDSTIADNNAVGGTGGAGGQGGNPGKPSTDAGSIGGPAGSGGSAEGGGISARSAFALDNSTVGGNKALGNSAGDVGIGGSGTPPGSQGQAGFQGHGAGGGIYAPAPAGSPAVVVSVSSLIASNTANTDFPDVVASFDATDTLIQVGDGAVGITNGGDGNFVGVDAKLGPLEDNGGPTPTMALLPGSPAIDAGSNPLNLTTDQRGFGPRAVGAAPDIGAYESGAQPLTPAKSSGKDGGSHPGGETNPIGEVAILFAIIKVKHRREVRVTDSSTGAVKFVVFPFGTGYRGKLVLSTADVDGVEDLVARRPHGHKRFITEVFSGLDGSLLSSVTSKT